MFRYRYSILVMAVVSALAGGAALGQVEREPINRREVLLRAARNQTTARQYEKAAGYYREYLETWPDDVVIAVEFGGVLIQAGRTQEAVQLLETAIDKEPENLTAYRLLADAAAILKDWPKAGSALEAALAREPGDAELRVKLAEVSAWSGKYEDAIRQYRMLLLDRPDDRKRWAGLLQVLYWAGMYDEYLAESGRFLSKYPDEEAIRMNRVDLFAARKDFAAAAQECREVLVRNPEQRLARARRAQFLAWMGMWEEAREEYGKALALSPEDTGLRREYGELLLWTGRYDQARDVFRRLLTDLPGDEGVVRDYLETISRVKPFADEDRKWAEDYYRRMFKEGRKLRPSTLAALGRAMKAAGNEEDALGIFDAAMKANPEDMRLRLEYADLLSALGRVDEAEAQYDILLKEAGKTNNGAKSQEAAP
jgi:tetratricopeptide (TPR) repeat protein